MALTRFAGLLLASVLAPVACQLDKGRAIGTGNSTELISDGELAQLVAIANETRPTLDIIESVQAMASAAGNSNNLEDMMKFPLYMRILATIACLVIFTIGVCGNLLVPLVVIKTKYLRNSTNLFLINLSIADLLVLIVCMPIVLVELHSRPETWLLGEPMCKLSNFVEMLAANGSIFTILAISFERYYAICKPLKAGYKCTRLRAAIIIGLIWLLATILTSPILIMAKSRETVFMDGTPVYNCVLETDTYWTKMYVFVSMVAFFWLPLLVLMLVYWLIGRKLTRESVALSTTTSLTTTDSNLDPTGQALKSSSNFSPKPEPSDSQKCTLLKSISTFFSSLNHDRYSRFRLSNHAKHPLDNQFSVGAGDYRGTKYIDAACPFSTRGRGVLTSSKSLCLDDRHHIHGIKTMDESRKDSVNVAAKETICAEGHRVDYDGLHNTVPGCCLLKSNSIGERKPSANGKLPLKGSLASQFINQIFFRVNGERKSAISAKNEMLKKSLAGDNLSHGNTTVSLQDQVPDFTKNVYHKTFSGDHVSDPASNHSPRDYYNRRPSFARGCILKAATNHSDRRIHHFSSEREPRFNWIKQFSVSSSANSVKTNCTMLASECSPLNSDSYEQKSDSQRSPRPILQNCHSMRNDSCRSSRKKNARFEDSDVIGSDSRPESSLSGINSSSSRSKSASPESVRDEILELGGAIDVCERVGHISREINQPSTDKHPEPEGNIFAFHRKLTKFATTDNPDYQPISTPTVDGNVSDCRKIADIDSSLEKKRLANGSRSVANSNSNSQPDLFNSRRPKRGSQMLFCGHHNLNPHINELYVVQDISKKQQMDSRRQVVVMLGFVVACFFMLFFPYRIFTLWLILSSEDQVLSLGMEAYYNLTYFSRILIYLHSAINPIAYNLISTKFRRAFMSILLCQGSSSRRQYTTDHRAINSKTHSNEQTYKR